MRWTEDRRRETEWEEWWAWHAVPVESLFTGSDVIFSQETLRMIRWERIERRKTALPNNRSTYIYRCMGSNWDAPTMSRRPPTAPPDRVFKEEQLPPESL